MKKILIAIIVILIFVSCKKTRKCICTSNGTNTTVFSTTLKISDARKKCDDYYNTNFASIPMNETYCELH